MAVKWFANWEELTKETSKGWDSVWLTHPILQMAKLRPAYFICSMNIYRAPTEDTERRVSTPSLASRSPQASRRDRWDWAWREGPLRRGQARQGSDLPKVKFTYALKLWQSPEKVPGYQERTLPMGFSVPDTQHPEHPWSKLSLLSRENAKQPSSHHWRLENGRQTARTIGKIALWKEVGRGCQKGGWGSGLLLERRRQTQNLATSSQAYLNHGLVWVIRLISSRSYWIMMCCL